METKHFIESAAILGLNVYNARNTMLTAEHFGTFGKLFDYTIKYIETHGENPPVTLLVSKSGNDKLDTSAVGVNFQAAELELISTAVAAKMIESFETIINSGMREDKINTINAILNCAIEAKRELPLEISGDVWDDGSLIDTPDGNTLIKGIPTPVDELTYRGGSLEPGTLATVFARPEVGKTWFLVKQAAQAYKTQSKVLFVSTEMSRGEIGSRLDTFIGHDLGYNFTHHQLKTGMGLDRNAYDMFRIDFNKRNIHIVDGSDRVINLDSIKRLANTGNFDIVIVDGFHSLSTGSKKYKWESLSDSIYEFKQTCVQASIPALISVQANRNAGNIHSAPTAEDIALSDGMLQASTYVFSLHKELESPTKMNLTILKSRDVDVTKRKLKLDWDVDIGIISQERLD